jgi:hypothetical protein
VGPAEETVVLPESVPADPEHVRPDPPAPGLTADGLLAGLANLEGQQAGEPGERLVARGSIAEAYLAANSAVPDSPDRDPRSALADLDAGAVDPADLALDPELIRLLTRWPAAALDEPTPIFDQLVAERAAPPPDAPQQETPEQDEPEEPELAREYHPEGNADDHT